MPSVTRLLGARLVSMARSGIIALIVLFAFASVLGCATTKQVVTAVAQDIVDCAKPEITVQIPNVIGSVNRVLEDPSKLQEVKQQEITVLLHAKDNLIACVLRQVISDIRDVVGAQTDPGASRMQEAASSMIKQRGYRYADGWEDLSASTP